MTDRSREQLTALAAIRQVVKKNDLELAQKLSQIEQLIDRHLPSDEDWQAGAAALDQLEQINDRYHQQDAYYEWLSKNSVKLQRRVSNLIRLLVIDETTSGQGLVQALRYFAQHKELGAAAPTKFLTLTQPGKILDERGNFGFRFTKSSYFSRRL